MALIPNRIAEHRKKKKWSQQKLADAVSAHWITISKLERGITKLNVQWAERLAKALEVDTYDILPIKRKLGRISFTGYIRSGGLVEGVDENNPEIVSFENTIFDDYGSDWLKVTGDTLYPYFQDGDALRITWVDPNFFRFEDGTSDFSQFHGRFCYVDDGDGQRYIGVIGPSETEGCVDLYNSNFPPLRGFYPITLGQVTVAMMSYPDPNPDDGEEKK